MTMHNQPTISISAALAQVATIVSVKATSLGMTRTDKQASRESDRAHNALTGTSKVVVSRLTGSGEQRVKAINQITNQLSADLRYMTTTWNDEQRLLINNRMQEFLGIWGKAKGEHTTLVDSFVADASTLIAEASNNLGSFNITPPTEEEIREAFSLEFSMMPIADTSTFKTSGLDAQMEAEMKRRIEDSIAAAYNGAVTDAMKKVAAPLSNLVDRMEKYSKRENDKAKGLTVTKEGTFKDTVTTNVDEMAAVFQ